MSLRSRIERLERGNEPPGGNDGVRGLAARMRRRQGHPAPTSPFTPGSLAERMHRRGELRQISDLA